MVLEFHIRNNESVEGFLEYNYSLFYYYFNFQKRQWRMDKMNKILLNERASLDRPAWTSEQKTGSLQAYKHKHSIIRGKFTLQENYYEKR